MPKKRQQKYDESRLPDGGWGWMVVLGVAVTNMFNQSLVSVFGLLFGEYLEGLGHGTAGVSLVANINNMVTCFSGLVMGPILNKFSCRQVSGYGALLTAIGMMMSSFAESITELILFYSVLTGLGLGLIYPSTFVAIKGYFSTRRSTAVGLSMAGTGVGQMLMPQLVSYLLETYGFCWTTRIIGALCLNGAVGALLFQPVHWHLKPEIKDSTASEKLLSHDVEVKIEDTKGEKTNGTLVTEFTDKSEVQEESSVKFVKSEKEPQLNSWQKFVKSLDLNLLKDPSFVNICCGLALVYTAGMAFGMIFPFLMLEGVGLTRRQAALCMTLLSASDIAARLSLPLITGLLRLQNRTTFMWGALALALARTVIAEQDTYSSMIAASILCGYIRAITVINQNLTVSDHCRDDQLPAALGLMMVSKGVFVMSLGQLLGWFRDYTKSFSLFIHATNILLLVVFITWGVEMIITRLRRTSH